MYESNPATNGIRAEPPSHADPIPAIDNTVRLIDRDNAFLLFDYVGTPTTTRCLPLLKRRSKESVLLFCPFTGAQPQRQQPYSDFAFNLRASYYQETGGLVDHFVEIGRKRVGRRERLFRCFMFSEPC